MTQINNILPKWVVPLRQMLKEIATTTPQGLDPLFTRIAAVAKEQPVIQILRKELFKQALEKTVVLKGVALIEIKPMAHPLLYVEQALFLLERIQYGLTGSEFRISLTEYHDMTDENVSQKTMYELYFGSLVIFLDSIYETSDESPLGDGNVKSFSDIELRIAIGFAITIVTVFIILLFVPNPLDSPIKIQIAALLMGICAAYSGPVILGKTSVKGSIPFFGLTTLEMRARGGIAIFIIVTIVAWLVFSQNSSKGSQIKPLPSTTSTATQSIEQTDNHTPGASDAIPFGGISPAEISDSNVIGIDISAFNIIDWKQFDPKRVAFIYIKASEGLNTSRKFLTDWQEAGKLNLARGAYLYYNPKEDGLKQAVYFINLVKPNANDLPCAVDLERPSENWNGKQVLDCLMYIESKTKKKPLIYTDASFWNNYFNQDRNITGKYPLWIAKYYTTITTSKRPVLPDGWQEYKLLQFSDKGILPGVTGDVSLSKYNGTLAELNQLRSASK